MKIVIMGSGYFGLYIVSRFLQEKHDIVVIDEDPLILKKFNENYDVLTVQGNGASAHILQQAGIEKADILLALSDSDEANIIACYFANHYGVLKKIARITHDKKIYFPSLSENFLLPLGIDFIVNPYYSCAQEFFNSITLHGVSEEMSFAGGSVIVGAFHVAKDHAFSKKSLKTIEGLDLHEIRFVAFARGDQVIIPRGDDFFEEGDEVFFICHRKHKEALMNFLNIDSYCPKKVVINGGSLVALHLAQMLEKAKIEVKIIEQNQEKAHFLSDHLFKSMIFQGPATDPNILEEVNLLDVDAFVSVTDSDESNILSCVLAKQMLVKKTYCLVKRSEYANFFSAMMKINDVVNVRSVFINTIIRFLRSSEVATVGSLRHVDAEVMEIVIGKDFKVIDEKISDLNFPYGSLIGLIIRQGNVIFAKGDEIIDLEDRLIVFYIPSTVERINDIFGKKVL